jgi:hypothetical protein
VGTAPPLDAGLPPAVDASPIRVDAGAIATDELARCVEVLNTLRGTIGARTLASTPALQAFANESARSDATTGRANDYFSRTNGGNYVASGQAVIPGWPLGADGSIRAVVDRGVRQIWDAGPSDATSARLRDPAYQHAACGGYVTDRGAVWVVLAFH